MVRSASQTFCWKGVPSGGEGQREIAAQACEIVADPFGGPAQQGRGFRLGAACGALRNLCAESDGRYGLFGRRDRQRADRRFELHGIRHKFFRV